MEKKFLHDSESSDLRSEVLNSSKTSAKKIKEKMEVSETWDKLELFVKKHREKLLKQKLSSNGPSKKVEFVMVYFIISLIFNRKELYKPCKILHHLCQKRD